MIICLIVILVVSSVPLAYSHPKTLDAHVVVNGTDIAIKIIGLENIPATEEDIEVFSEKWTWNNFILILVVTIALTMAFTVIVIYREDLCKIIK